MSKPIIRIHNSQTDEITDREMNDQEFAQYEADKEAKAQAEANAQAQATAKAALLERLGISEQEAKLLLG